VVEKAATALGVKADQEFDPEELARVDPIIDRYKLKPGSLILALEEIQEAIGYLPKSIQRKVALGLGIPFSEVYGVVTFYSFFTMVPRGRHTIRCCLGTACYVKGGKKNLEKLSGTLGVKTGSTFHTTFSQPKHHNQGDYRTTHIITGRAKVNIYKIKMALMSSIYV